ncbi:MAG: hypothetical protein IKH07_06420 [Oscillospiraceae bacterium]|nr:hypothetical protein [Oscillospiraceae bacterium]
MKKNRCEYCGERYDASLRRCPHCGGLNPLAFRAEDREAQISSAGSGEAYSAQDLRPEEDRQQGVIKPRTIDELQRFAADHNLPLRKMRVHLGEDYRGARAYGIYQAEDGSFVVYKNKSDGSRAVRYQGSDEAYAVNELFLKMKEQIALQPARRAAVLGGTRRAFTPSPDSTPPAEPPSWKAVVKKNAWKYLLILLICTVIWYAVKHRGPSKGYYRYGGDYYYYQSSNWYHYNSGSSQWYPVTVDDALSDNYRDYFQSDDYESSYGVQDFAYSYDPAPNDNQPAGGWDWNEDRDDGNDWNWDDDRDDWNDNDWNWDDDWDWDDDGGGWDWDDDDGWDWDDGGDWDSDW